MEVGQLSVDSALANFSNMGMRMPFTLLMENPNSALSSSEKHCLKVLRPFPKFSPLVCKGEPGTGLSPACSVGASELER